MANFIVHWVLCGLIGYVGFFRCIELSPTSDLVTRLGTAASVPLSILWAAAPPLLQFRPDSITIFLTLAVMVTLVGELEVVREWARKAFPSRQLLNALKTERGKEEK